MKGFPTTNLKAYSGCPASTLFANTVSLNIQIIGEVSNLIFMARDNGKIRLINNNCRNRLFAKCDIYRKGAKIGGEYD